jgi:hypothetical protein
MLYTVTMPFAALLTLVVGIDVTPAAAATCASLANLALPDTTITAAEPVVAGTYTAPDGEVFTNLPAFCRIAATLTPTLAQLACFGEFDRGAFSLAVEGIGGGERGVKMRVSRIDIPRLLQPDNRVVGARLQKMRLTDPHIKCAD